MKAGALACQSRRPDNKTATHICIVRLLESVDVSKLGHMPDACNRQASHITMEAWMQEPRQCRTNKGAGKAAAVNVALQGMHTEVLQPVPDAYQSRHAV